MGDYFETAAKISGNPKTTANWIITEVLRVLKDSQKPIEEFEITPEHLGEIVKLIGSGAISGKIAKKVFEIKLTDKRGTRRDRKG